MLCVDMPGLLLTPNRRENMMHTHLSTMLCPFTALVLDPSLVKATGNTNKQVNTEKSYKKLIILPYIIIQYKNPLSLLTNLLLFIVSTGQFTVQ